jgi:DivIVA domain-containing protein
VARFQVVLRGYDRRQVDAFIDRVEGTLGRGPLNGSPVSIEEAGDVRFDVVLRGYARHDVEARISQYRQELQGRGPDGDNGDGELATLIRRRPFRTVPAGGYDPDEVEAFLDEIASRLRAR